MARLLVHLAGPGREREHVDARIVGGDPTSMMWCGHGSLDRATAFAVARHVERPRRAFGTEVSRGSVWHCSLSLSPEETERHCPSDARWEQIARDFAREMGFTRARTPCRWVAIRHGNSIRGHDHVHVVASRVADNGNLSDVQGDFTRAQRIADVLAREHRLTLVEGREGAPGYSPTAKARAERTGEPALPRTALELTVRACARDAGDEAAFVRGLREEGLSIRPRYDRAGAVDGYSVALPSAEEEDELWFGAGTLEKDLTLPRLRSRHGWNGTPESASATADEWSR